MTKKYRYLVASMLGHMLTPTPASVTPSAMFGVAEPDGEAGRLGAIPQAVVHGFDVAWTSATTLEVHERLELLNADLQGFGYEGATMASAVLDALPGRRTTRVAELISGPGSRHFLLSYIGLGFAMARTPRAIWPRLQPEELDHPHHPHMSWLAVDGYGFDLAYFNSKRYVDQQRRPAPYAWHPGAESYFNRAVDQGIGRALWFMRPRAYDVSDLIFTFAPERRADLWSGVGLAATFAGPSTAAQGLAKVAAKAGHHVALAVGACFALQGRLESGNLPDHTRQIFGSIAGLGIGEGQTMVHESLTGSAGRPGHLRYESIRQDLAVHFEQLRTKV